MGEHTYSQNEQMSTARRDQTSERLYDAASVVDMQDALAAAQAQADSARRAAAWAAGAPERERQARVNREGAAAARAYLGLPPTAVRDGGLTPDARAAIAESRARSAARQAASDQLESTS